MEKFKKPIKNHTPAPSDDAAAHDSNNLTSSQFEFEVLTLKEFAKAMKLSKSTIYSRIKKGSLVAGRHFFRDGRHYRFIWGKELINIFLAESLAQKPDQPPCPRPVAQKPGPPSRPKVAAKTSKLYINLDY